MNIVNISQLDSLHNESTKWRRELHQYPQTSYEEEYAHNFIISKFKKWNIKYHKGLAKTGVVGIIRGKKDSNKKIALRADIDALDIKEENNFEYKSKYLGKMHACGHDGHTSMLLAAAKYLAETRNFAGTVYLIFQPAEEGGAGAKRMIEEGLFDLFPVESVWGMHNTPGLDVGEIQVKSGPMLASANEFEIEISGIGGHAAMPHHAIDPILVGSQIIVATQSLIARRLKPTDAGVVSITEFHGGTAFNIIPDKVVLNGTIRAIKEKTRLMLIKNLKEIVNHISVAFGAKAKYVQKPNPYPILVNTEKETVLAEKIAQETVNKVSRAKAPILGGEDFAFMLQKKPGSFIFLGNGLFGELGGQQLHTSKYDFNDNASIYGIKYWINLVETILTV